MTKHTSAMSLLDYMQDDNHAPLMPMAPWGGKGHKTYGPPCHEGHTAFAVGKGHVRGGNCDSPKAGYDIYVGLDWAMTNSAPFPWENASKDVIDIHYPIKDMGVPKNAAEFKRMIQWLHQQLVLGKKVHVGCIGGHGRTGLVLAALLAWGGDTDAITTVRKLHCKKAVESHEQIEFLVKHFGVKAVKAAKSYAPVKASGNLRTDSNLKAYRPFPGARCIWGDSP